MVQILIFFFFIGICALIFSKAEGITYVNGIYYMVVTTLTIGFGDITPHTAVMKVFTFPFAVIGLTLLAVVVTSIVKLLSDRARRRKLAMTKRLKEKSSEKKRILAKSKSSSEEKESKMNRNLTLQEELHKLRAEDWKRERRANLRSITIGMSVFFLFWFLGALIFHCVEVGSLFLLIFNCSPGDTAMLSIFAICLFLLLKIC